MNPVFMVLLENREQDGKEEHKMPFDMDSIIWLVIMVPCSMLFTGIGIFAWNRKNYVDWILPGVLAGILCRSMEHGHCRNLHRSRLYCWNSGIDTYI